ncbi:MAG: DUF1805 domain-containing protein [Elusimicrobia bacterium]|nr:DUF1805 domain-containing protein [Elusimicrobiota bacterium]
MKTRDIVVNKKTAQGIEIPLMAANLVMVITPKGYLMCGYLDIKTAEKMGDCAAVIRGVKTIDALLEGKVVEITTAAAAAGIKLGMTGIKALAKIS